MQHVKGDWCVVRLEALRPLNATMVAEHVETEAAAVAIAEYQRRAALA